MRHSGTLIRRHRAQLAGGKDKGGVRLPALHPTSCVRQSGDSGQWRQGRALPATRQPKEATEGTRVGPTLISVISRSHTTSIPAPLGSHVAPSRALAQRTTGPCLLFIFKRSLLLLGKGGQCVLVTPTLFYWGMDERKFTFDLTLRCCP